MDCKKCENFIELKDSDNEDTLYICRATSIFRTEAGAGFIYLLTPEIFNETISDCIDFKPN